METITHSRAVNAESPAAGPLFRSRRLASAVLTGVFLTLAASAAAADGSAWTVAGRQGMVRIVIVPVEQAVDRGAYERQVALLCVPEQTCFINFYTNSTAAPVDMPLADAIANESTATFRRSVKQGAERLTWSCRMKVAGEPCF